MQEGMGEDAVILPLMHNPGRGEVQAVEEFRATEGSHRDKNGYYDNYQCYHVSAFYA